MKYCVLISLLILANALYAQEPVSATIKLSVYVSPNETGGQALNTDSLDYSSECAKLEAEEAGLELPAECDFFVVETTHGDHVHLSLNPI